jgi:hypothetical protein
MVRDEPDGEHMERTEGLKMARTVELPVWAVENREGVWGTTAVKTAVRLVYWMRVRADGCAHVLPVGQMKVCVVSERQHHARMHAQTFFFSNLMGGEG